ncbi:hypothetical protein BJX70DRAFT_230478 [Aspergillus crustosus]
MIDASEITGSVEHPLPPPNARLFFCRRRYSITPHLHFLVNTFGQRSFVSPPVAVLRTHVRDCPTRLL